MANQRRRFLTGSASIALAYSGLAVASGAKSARQRTPSETAGPFYPVAEQKDQDFDLTQIAGRSGVASGTPIWIHGRVLDVEGKPIEDAVVDLWQANSAGRYNHSRDPNPAPLDPNFQGWAIVPSGVDGGFKFKTVMPGAYPASRNWSRPPHLHFKITRQGYQALTTQMYFPDHPLNAKDLLLQSKSVDQQRLMVAEKISDAPETYSYEIVLSKR